MPASTQFGSWSTTTSPGPDAAGPTARRPATGRPGRRRRTCPTRAAPANARRNATSTPWRRGRRPPWPRAWHRSTRPSARYRSTRSSGTDRRRHRSRRAARGLSLTHRPSLSDRTIPRPTRHASDVARHENFVIVRCMAPAGDSDRPATAPAPVTTDSTPCGSRRVVRRDRPTPARIVLEVPRGAPCGFAYEAGQFCTFRVWVDGEPYLRCYSMSSSPRSTPSSGSR